MARKRTRRGKRGAGGAQAPALPLAPAPARGPGRPSKFTDKVADTIVEAIRDGVPRVRAARIAGITSKTLFEWLAEGARQEFGKFRDFRDRVERASDELCHEAVQVQRKLLSDPDPKVRGAASRFVLAYMFSSDFSTKAQVETTGKDGGPVEVEHSGIVGVRPVIDAAALAALTDEQLEALGRGLG